MDRCSALSVEKTGDAPATWTRCAGLAGHKGPHLCWGSERWTDGPLGLDIPAAERQCPRSECGSKDVSIEQTAVGLRDVCKKCYGLFRHATTPPDADDVTSTPRHT